MLEGRLGDERSRLGKLECAGFAGSGLGLEGEQPGTFADGIDALGIRFHPCDGKALILVFRDFKTGDGEVHELFKRRGKALGRGVNLEREFLFFLGQSRIEGLGEGQFVHWSGGGFFRPGIDDLRGRAHRQQCRAK